MNTEYFQEQMQMIPQKFMAAKELAVEVAKNDPGEAVIIAAIITTVGSILTSIIIAILRRR